MALADFVTACLLDPDHGYYTNQTVFGGHGDFTTAPEISQIFGEVIGIWCLTVWQQFGKPEALRIVELGPGRGTLMADLLRGFTTVAKATGGPGQVSVTLVEASEKLAAEQAKALAHVDVVIAQARDLGEVEPGPPTIVIANEFFDALPITQSRWCMQPDGRLLLETRHVIDCEGALQFAWIVDDAATTDEAAPDEGKVREARAQDAVLTEFARLAAEAPLMALIIDYGTDEAHRNADTLQAVRNHAYEHPLTSPGEADLSSLVDFPALRDAASAHGLAATEIITQSEFLGELGAVERAAALIQNNSTKRGEIEASIARLMAPNGMGTRFKVMAVGRQDCRVPLGFPQTRATGPARQREAEGKV